MLKTPKLIALLVAVVLALGVACGLVDETTEANKLVVEANGLIVQDNQQALAAGSQLQELLGSGLGAVKNIETYKSQNKAKLDELAAQFAQIESNETLITDKFRQASQFKLNEKYKQYLDLKTQEFGKQTEAAKLVNPLIKSFMEAKDMPSVMTKLEEFDTKYATINKEITDLQAQSEQLVKDNPTLIK